MNEKYLQTIKELQKCTESYWGYTKDTRDDYIKIEELASKLEPCNQCALREKFKEFYKQNKEKKTPYCVVYPYPEKVKIMFISRDPNFSAPEQCKENKEVWPGGELENILKQEKPNNNTISDGVIRALTSEDDKKWESKQWEMLERFIRGQEISEITKRIQIYWTHLVKCFTDNNDKNVKVAEKTCMKILAVEIIMLKPDLVIGFGGNVRLGLKELLDNEETKTLLYEDKKIKNLFENAKKYLNEYNKMDHWITHLQEAVQSGVVILPHFSSRNVNFHYCWENGLENAIKTNHGQTFSILPLKQKVNELLGK